MNTARLDALVQKVRSLADPSARDAALELVQAVMDLHAASLERMMEIVDQSAASEAIFDAYADDEQVGGMLLLHDLHPLDLEQRVRRALDQPAFQGRGVAVEVLSAREGIVRVRIERGSASKAEVEKALTVAAPDAVDVIVEGGADQNGSSNFVPLAQLLAG